MANEQNLRPCEYKLSQEEAKRGGIASGAARRRKKTLKEELILLLESGDVQSSVAASLINEAINGNKTGSVARAFEVIRDTVGEKPVDKVMISEIDPGIIDEVEKAVLDEGV